MTKIIFQILITYLLVNANLALADFGDSCSVPTGSDFDEDIIENQSQDYMFGFVKSIIDIENCGKEYKNGCSARKTSELEFCVKKKGSNSLRANSSNSRRITVKDGGRITLGQMTDYPSIIAEPNLNDLVLRVANVGNNICLFMQTIYGYLPVLCRHTSRLPETSNSVFDRFDGCREISEACDLVHGSNHSRSQFNAFGAAVQCVYESLDIVFLDPRSCTRRRMDKEDMESFLHNWDNETKVKPFAEFFDSMRNIVAGMLTLYVVFFGIKTAISPESFNVKEAFIAVAKMILVVYFSVGSANIDWLTRQKTTQNGVIDFILPTMINFSTSFATFAFNNSITNELCTFDSSIYERGYEYYAIWDAIDCRFNIYVGGMNIFWTDEKRSKGRLVSSPSNGTHHDVNIDLSNFPESFKPPDSESIEALKAAGHDTDALEGVSKGLGMMVLAFLFLITGGFVQFFLLNFMLFIFAGMFFSFLISYIIFITIIYILAYIAPIFVPMALFNRTYGYFNGWLNLCISSCVQPMIILGFGAYLITLVDSFIFDQCLFAKYEMPNGNFEYEILLPTIEQNKQACQNSFGYKIFKYLLDSTSANNVNLLLFQLIIIEDVFDLESSLWSSMIMMVLISYAINQVYMFSAKMTNGINITEHTMQSTMIANKVKKAASTAAKAPYKTYKHLKGKK